MCDEEKRLKYLEPLKNNESCGSERERASHSQVPLRFSPRHRPLAAPSLKIPPRVQRRTGLRMNLDHSFFSDFL